MKPRHSVNDNKNDDCSISQISTYALYSITLNYA